MSETAAHIPIKLSGSGHTWPVVGVRWLVFFFALGAIVLPDCCLNGRHRMGDGMDAFGMICYARP
jgi:hypothetical protein